MLLRRLLGLGAERRTQPRLPAGLTHDLSHAAVQLASASTWPRGAVVNAKDGSVLVAIPAAKAIFGSSDADEDAFAKEQPQFRASLPGYYIAVTTVTNAQYKRFVDATGRRAPANSEDPELSVWSGGTYPSALADHPVVNVSWGDAEAYCAWAGLRLPSELEWEKGARGTDGRVYPWGTEWDASRCWCRENRTTAPVGSYPMGTGPYGLFEMAGNVLEWCGDWYDATAYTRYARGDLTRPCLGESRVLRGGSWFTRETDYFQRCAYRDCFNPTNADNFLGFRVARDL